MNEHSWDTPRPTRVDVNKPCILNPWGVPAELENMSLSGALVNSQYFPDEMLMACSGELVLDGIKIPGEFVRLDKLKIGIEFDHIDSVLKRKIEGFLASF